MKVLVTEVPKKCLDCLFSHELISGGDDFESIWYYKCMLLKEEIPYYNGHTEFRHKLAGCPLKKM